jgi:hypothetical protein
MMPRARASVCVFAGAALLAVLPLSAQQQAQQPPRGRITASVETGAAAVEQPLVRSGAAFYVAPSARLSARGFNVGGDAVLATGTPIWQSFLGNAFIQTPAIRGVRITSGAQFLKTSGLVPIWHGDLGAEWRNTSSELLTTSVRARVGGLRYDGALWRDMDVGGGVIRSHGAMLLALDANLTSARRPFGLQNQLGISGASATEFSAQALDFTPRMIWERGRLRTDASVSLRAAQRGLRGTRVGPQLSFTWATARGVSLFLGGVQRLPDIRSGVPSGRSALLGLRLEGTRIFSRASTRASGEPALLIIDGMLVIDAGIGSAARAAMRGDFTDWQVRTCQPRGTRFFDCGVAPSAGTYRVAIRVNDGDWRQPANLAAAADDFGSVDGLLLTGGKP